VKLCTTQIPCEVCREKILEKYLRERAMQTNTALENIAQLLGRRSFTAVLYVDRQRIVLSDPKSL
jgi:hypothetical protein